MTGGDPLTVDFVSRLYHLAQARGQRPQLVMVKDEGVESSTRFHFEATLCSHKGLGTAPVKKDARKEAARALLEILEENGIDLGPLMKSKTIKLGGGGGGKVRFVGDGAKKQEGACTMTVVTNKELWTKCLKLLPSDDDDFVKQLKIFSLNSNTGLPQYQVNNPGKNDVLVEVFCTWNKFFLSARAEDKSVAEQNAAKATLNKVREVCGLDPLPQEASVKKNWTPKSRIKAPGEVSLDKYGGEGLMTAFKEVVAKAEALKPRSWSFAKQLEEVSHRVGGESPEFTISGIENSGTAVTVRVTCKWRGMVSVGKGESKTLAEVEASKVMMDTLGKFAGPPPVALEERMAEGEEDALDIKKEEEAEDEEDDETKYCCFPQGGAANVTVTRKDYLCLRNQEFLNDVIIDFYLKWLQHGFFINNPAMQERTHIFSIYFYNRLTQKPKIKLTANAPPMSPAERRYDHVKKWTKNTNIFEKDFVIVPINHEDHWYVVLICYPALTKPREYNGRVECPVMLLLDSLEDGMKDEVVANLREYLACEWREKMVVGQGKEVRLFQQSSMPHFCPDIPQQPNLTDCGLYLLEYVEAFFRSPIKDFSVPIASLASWFTADQVQGKRESIAGLIRRLAAEQSPEKTFDFPNLEFGENMKTDKLGELKADHEKIKINLKPKVNTSEEASPAKRASNESVSSQAVLPELSDSAESPKLQWKKARLGAS